MLADERLYAWIGGRPPTPAELAARYERLVAGPDSADTLWLNWVTRRRSDGRAVGYVQATLSREPAGWSADLAWLVGGEFQSAGVATEATRAVVAQLRAHRVERLRAHVADGNAASAKVAVRVGLLATDQLDDDGERLYVQARRT